MAAAVLPELATALTSTGHGRHARFFGSPGQLVVSCTPTLGLGHHGVTVVSMEIRWGADWNDTLQMNARKWHLDLLPDAIRPTVDLAWAEAPGRVSEARTHAAQGVPSA